MKYSRLCLRLWQYLPERLLRRCHNIQETAAHAHTFSQRRHFHSYKSQRHCEVIAFQFHANFHTPRILYVQYAHFSMHAYYAHTLTGRRHCQTSAIQFYANSHTRCIAFSTLVDQNGGTPNRATHVTQNILHGLPGNNANFTIHSNLWTWDLGWHNIWTSALYIKCHIFRCASIS